jgi:hypothetical protein
MAKLPHPMTAEEAAKLGARRCYLNGYPGIPALAYPARTRGYVNVQLLKDPGFGSMYVRGCAPSNCQFLDETGGG